MIRAVVFDFDGTLADNMVLVFNAYKKALEGIRKIAPSDLFMREGGRAKDIMSDLSGKNDEGEISDLVSIKEREYEKTRDKVILFPGGKDLIKRLKTRGIKVGLVTGTYRKNLHLIMNAEEIESFDYILTGSETENPKPSPEPYLKCLESLRIDPKESIAVENAPLGIRSAKSAGMVCIAIMSTLQREHLGEADYIVKDLKEASDIILEKIIPK